MKLLAFGDPHLKPGGESVDLDAIRVPSDVDAVVTTGDVIHRTDPDSLALAREFFERLHEAGIPVICTPGNHDPQDQYDSLVGDLPTVVNAHDRVVTGEAFPSVAASAPEASEGAAAGSEGVPADLLDGHAFVGWGCESTTFEPEIRLTAVSALDPRDAEGDRRYAADRAAGRLEDAAFDHVTGDRDAGAFAEAVGVVRSERSAFREGVERLEALFDRLDALLAAAPEPTVVLTHVPPYNTSLDRHHSIGAREHDLDGLHVGAIGLKLALRKHRPVASLSGHSHNGAYQPGLSGDGGPPHMLNLDFRTVLGIEVDGNEGSFSYTVT